MWKRYGNCLFSSGSVALSCTGFNKYLCCDSWYTTCAMREPAGLYLHALSRFAFPLELMLSWTRKALMRFVVFVCQQIIFSDLFLYVSIFRGYFLYDVMICCYSRFLFVVNVEEWFSYLLVEFVWPRLPAHNILCWPTWTKGVLVAKNQMVPASVQSSRTPFPVLSISESITSFFSLLCALISSHSWVTRLP